MKDPYILENGTLKNLLKITDPEELEKAETDIAYIKLLNAEETAQETSQETSRTECSVELLKKVHKHIFGDIYDWAGKFRTTPIYKEERVIPGVSLEYAQPKKIKTELNKKIKEMNNYNWKNKDIDEITKQFTQYLAQIWRIHPFRDGNTRTTLTFASIFAKQHGFEMDMGTILNNLGRIEDPKTGRVIRWNVRDKFVLAALDPQDYPEPEGLERIIKASIEKGKDKKIEELNQMTERNGKTTTEEDTKKDIEEDVKEI